MVEFGIQVVVEGVEVVALNKSACRVLRLLQYSHGEVVVAAEGTA